jgi:hypothetical protein
VTSPISARSAMGDAASAVFAADAGPSTRAASRRAHAPAVARDPSPSVRTTSERERDGLTTRSFALELQKGTSLCLTTSYRPFPAF